MSSLGLLSFQLDFGTYEDKTKDAHPRTTNIDEDIVEERRNKLTIHFQLPH